MATLAKSEPTVRRMFLRVLLALTLIVVFAKIALLLNLNPENATTILILSVSAVAMAIGIESGFDALSARQSSIATRTAEEDSRERFRSQIRTEIHDEIEAAHAKQKEVVSSELQKIREIIAKELESIKHASEQAAAKQYDAFLRRFEEQISSASQKFGTEMTELKNKFEAMSSDLPRGSGQPSRNFELPVSGTESETGDLEQHKLRNPLSPERRRAVRAALYESVVNAGTRLVKEGIGAAEAEMIIDLVLGFDFEKIARKHGTEVKEVRDFAEKFQPVIRVVKGEEVRSIEMIREPLKEEQS